MRRLNLAAAILLTVAAAASAATLPTGFTEVSYTGFSSPTAMAIAPDGRVFVCQQAGQLRVIKNGVVLATPFLTVTVDPAGERGLLGVAFDPDFSQNQYVYIYYTVPSPAHNRLSRFTANGDVAVPGSELILLELNNLSSATNHNGGAIHFGLDGKLYVAVGDNATSSNAQVLTNLLGKVLRVGAPPDPLIPTDNPFYDDTTGNNRAIWALGLRNPFTFGVQPETGRIFINDVGQNTWEEINDGFAGANYGWPDCEGPFVQGSTTEPCDDPDYTDPLSYYANSSTTCSIAGGAFYNPQVPQFPASYVGKYLFADYCGGWIRRLDPATLVVIDFATSISSPVDVHVSYDGYLYYIARGSGAVRRVAYTGSAAPVITQDPQSQTASVGGTATFDVAASGAPVLSYQWQKDSVNIGGANSPSYTTPTLVIGDSGDQYRCVVSNGSGSATSAQAVLTVTTNQPPVATITAPLAGTTYAAGSTINYSGTGTDPESGALTYTWWVDFHHDTHFHPFVPPTSGSTSGSFVIPTLGETSPNVWYRIHFLVTDPIPLTDEAFVDILPRTSTMTFQTNPTGLQVTVDGQGFTAPVAIVGVENMTRTISAPSPQGGNVWVSWSDGGARTHDISTPVSDTTYTATFSGGPTPTNTFTPSRTPTRTSTRTPTRTPTPTSSRTPTFTATRTLTPTNTRTPTFTQSRTSTLTATRTFTPSRTFTPTFTFTHSATPTLAPTTTTPSNTPSRTATRTPTSSRTPTPSVTPLPGAPAVSSIAPDSGPAAGGTGVTVAGSNFAGGATLKVGGVSASSVVVVNANQITGGAPTRPPGTLNDVTVTNPDTLSGTLAQGWLADFLDTPQSNLFHDDIETLFRNGVTAGCGSGNYCPNGIVTRAQMAVLVLRAKLGSGYQPPAATGLVFADVAAASFGAAWIEDLYARGYTSGCASSPLRYCPDASVTRAQMAVILLKAEHGSGYTPPACSGLFGDVACPAAFAVNWIEQFAAEGITVGCGGGNYCPNGVTPRGPMATFLVRTFSLTAGPSTPRVALGPLVRRP